MTEAPEAELVRAIAAGADDAPAAEAELCRRFAPRIRLYGLRHLRDQDRAADLVQAVLLALLQAARAGRIADPARVDRFMLGTSRNVAARMRETDARTAGDAALAAIAAPDEPLERIDTEALWRCLRALEERARRVLMLSFNDERSADEIATLLAISAVNVRVLRHRSIAALRRCLDAPKEVDA
ncbi:MAG TPA: sigma-70 family RNA polymerase sigma factor [Polyangia bacterium]|jgi:RNA polymerase sigma-70 factor (ECF subfamily)|nr:sigma-70 family RNA polymerase sigma factor [Polyangia bacterium]